MKFTELPLKGAFIIDLEKREDARGFFARYWCQEELVQIGLDANIVQINNSMTQYKGTVRGLHFQRPPKAETKIVRCIRGAVWDVIVDLRQCSPTYRKWHAVELNEENRIMIYIPKGFAHGFQTLADSTELLYLHSEFYSSEHEGGLRYDDPSVGVQWSIPMTAISVKDQNYPFLDELAPMTL